MEQQWLLLKAQAMADIEELLALGLSLDLARRLANWNLTYEFDDFADVQAYPPPPSPDTQPSFLREPANRLWVSLSENRWSAVPLKEAVLDSTKLYAVFQDDAPDAGITQIEYFLNGVSHHTEFSTPWDFNGTNGGGDANRFNFPVGVHTVTAEVTDSFGVWEVQATFEVQ